MLPEEDGLEDWYKLYHHEDEGEYDDDVYDDREDEYGVYGEDEDDLMDYEWPEVDED
jgi:hypothetical protein